jgi:hypothetical protein
MAGDVYQSLIDRFDYADPDPERARDHTKLRMQ